MAFRSKDDRGSNRRLEHLVVCFLLRLRDGYATDPQQFVYSCVCLGGELWIFNHRFASQRSS